MNGSHWMKLSLALAITGLAAVAGATGTYQSALEQGESYRGAGDTQAALAEYETALSLASNDTEKALALSKTAIVYARDRKDYAAARRAADEALRYRRAAPVGRVTALEALALCQMNADNNYDGAIATLREALALDGVDWAKPTLWMIQGDAYRFAGQFQDALSAFQNIIDWPAASSGIKAVAHLNTGFIHQYARKDAVKARAAYAEALALNPRLESEIATHQSTLP